MNDMKFRVESVTHSVLIQRALFRMGYGWLGGRYKEVRHEDQLYLYVDHGHKNISYSGNSAGGDAYFEAHLSPEYVYRLGMVEPRDGRPVQDVPPPLLDADDPSEMHAHMPDPKPYPQSGTIQFDNDVVVSGMPKPPIGIKPRAEADRMYHLSRGLELGAAINRYTNAQLVVPLEWLTEYNERVEEIRKLEKTA